MNFVRSGFRIVRQNPALVLAEVAWRWAFGLAAWVAVFITFRTILEGIDVSPAEVALTRSNDAYLIADAIMRVLVQVLPRLAEALIFLIPLLALVWIIAATIGRAVTLSALLDTRHTDVILSVAERSASDATPKRRTYVLSLFLLNLLRAVFTIATMLAFFGTIFLVSSQANPNMSPTAGPMLVLGWMCLALVIGLFWGIVNWFLALAPIFVVRDGFGVWPSISGSLRFYRGHPRDYSAIASMFGVIRGAALVIAVIAGTMTLAAGSVRGAVIASIIVAFMYFAVADYLYIARLAAYVELAVVPQPAIIAGPAVGPVAPVSPAPPDLGLET